MSTGPRQAIVGRKDKANHRLHANGRQTLTPDSRTILNGKHNSKIMQKLHG